MRKAATSFVLALCVSLGLALAVTARARAAAAPADSCAPCREAARSQPRYLFAVSAAGREMLMQAVRRTNMVFTLATARACAWDSLATPPGYHMATTSADTLALWRAALERLAAGGGVSGDSAGALGMSLLGAIDRAAAHPVRVRTEVTGRLVHEKGRVWLRGCGAPLEVTGAGADSLASAEGAPVWLQGECQAGERIEFRGAHALARPRIDLFVMSHCPFARRLESNLAEQLAKRGAAGTPVIAVHFLLFWDPDRTPETRAASLHGDAERVEDGVQMLLRDSQPQHLWPYLRLRAQSDEDWEVLAQRAGVPWQAIESMRRRLERDLDDMLVAEHQQVLRDFPRVAGSPTVYWQGVEVAGIERVPGLLAPAESSKEKCQN